MALPTPETMSEADYLAMDDASEIRHEYANGQALAMTGASWNHNLICVNIATQLNRQLAQKNCHVTTNDLRLKVLSRKHHRYPDVMVVCGEPQFVDERTDTISNPTMIAEVLSATTALTDRNEKLEEYLQIETVQEYLLVSQTEAKIERYRRQPSGDWVYSRISGNQSQIKLPSLGCTLMLANVYQKVTFE